jgi:hypothetical protein
LVDWRWLVGWSVGRWRFNAHAVGTALCFVSPRQQKRMSTYRCDRTKRWLS